MKSLLREPLRSSDLFERMEQYRKRDLDWRSGRTFAFVFHVDEELEAIAKRAYTMFMSENGLDPTAFSSLAQFENDIIEIAKSHLHAPPDAAGSFTSGGTESVLLAVKTARDFARSRRPELTEPEIVLPLTAHASFFKAAHYFGMRAVPVAVDPTTLRAQPDAMRAAITERTILLVASAPSYAHGVIDPITEIGAIAKEHDLLFHVDGCVGAFLLPFFKRLGAPVPEFDFSVPGVTSISMDLHKYAYCPKGASVVLYRDRSLRRHQIYACADWAGYSLVNTTIQSTKGGGPLAAAWAVLHYLGEPGYLRIAETLRDGMKKLRAGIESIPGLCVMGDPALSLLAFASDEVDVFHVVDELKQRGWYVQAQLARAGARESVHLTLMPNNVPHLDVMLEDLRASVEFARTQPSSPMVATMTAALDALDPSALAPDTLRQMLAMAGLNASATPDRMAEVNQVLNVLSPRVTEQLLIEFVNAFFA